MSKAKTDAARMDSIEQLGVYQVYTGTGTGSGFLIDPTHLVTNCHVVSPYRKVAVEMRDRTRILGTVRRVHPQRDLAVIELSRAVDGEVLRFSEIDRTAPKQPVQILGFPVGLPLSLTEGVISRSRQLLEEQYFLQTDAAINPGNSGGPMLDEQRRIIAVTTCKLDTADSVGFGIPIADVRRFVEEFRAQSVAFGAYCPACDELISSATRYCPGCGSNLDDRRDLRDFFRDPVLHPAAEFVEYALAQVNVDPLLARHGELNWSFYRGRTPIRVWCCCSDHLNFSARLAQPGKRGLGELFRHLLDAAHAPAFFDLYGSTIRMSLVVHMSDVFTPTQRSTLAQRVGTFLDSADAAAARLTGEFGCSPAPDVQDESTEPPVHLPG